MDLKFCKFHGAGNDFVMVNNLAEGYHLDTNLIAAICDRHRGIGADGLIILGPHQKYDFAMRYYNSDGKVSTMCGNGGRCITAFARMEGVIARTAVFMAADGTHEAEILEENTPSFTVRLQMRDVTGFMKSGNDIEINTGSPHYVTWRDSIEKMDILREAHEIRYSPEYNNSGINVDFVTVEESGLTVRTYERGVENETLSCGTGVTASAIAYAINKGSSGIHDIDVSTCGGKLKVSFQRKDDIFSNIWLLGPVKFVFRASIDTSGLI